MNLFYQPLIPEGIYHLDPDESRHSVKVLRMRNGDPIRVTDGSGKLYDAKITVASPLECKFEIMSTHVEARPHAIHIAISPTKNADRIEWFVEKATEIGISKITLVNCANSERSYLKKDRLQKVAVSAMKQSLKAWLPEITEMQQYSEVLKSGNEDQRFIAFVDRDNPDHLQRVAKPALPAVVLIGPEGDFTSEELAMAIAAGFRKVSLGDSRLRTETAGLAACHILNLINQS